MASEIKEGYTRISSILSPFNGLKDIDPEVLANAANRGTCTHHLCDFIVEGIGIFDSDVDDMVRKYAKSEEHFQKEKQMVLDFVVSFQKWAEGKSLCDKPERFYDNETMTTGEVDILYRGEHGLTIVDLKTPVSESKTWNVQGQGYGFLAKQNGLIIDHIEFVKLSRTGGMPKVYHYDLNPDLFLSVLKTYRYFYDGKKESETNLDYI